MLDLAAQAAGMEIVALYEPDPYCRHVLAYYHPGKVIYAYDTDITAERLRADGIGRIDSIIGGAPCQPASAAGKRLGESDPRWRWPEFLRIIGDVRPRWIVAENPPGILSLAAGHAFQGILAALERLGYRTGRMLVGADAVGAPHRRERVFIVGYLARPASGSRPHVTVSADGGRPLGGPQPGTGSGIGGGRVTPRIGERERIDAAGTTDICAGEALADPYHERCPGCDGATQSGTAACAGAAQRGDDMGHASCVTQREPFNENDPESDGWQARTISGGTGAIVPSNGPVEPPPWVAALMGLPPGYLERPGPWVRDKSKKTGSPPEPSQAEPSATELTV